MPEIREGKVLTAIRTPVRWLPSFFALAPEMSEAPKPQWSADDEYNLPGFEPLALREGNLPKNMAGQEEAWKERFRYLSITGGLEVNTNRTRIIEDKLKEAAEKAGQGEVGKTVRVVILNKGLTDIAFMAPDNTMFISQHLIHRLGYFDLVMGVASHEMKHTVDGFYENVNEIDPIKGYGLRWLAEPSADLHTSLYLESIDLNSLGLEKALAKLEEAHQEESGRSPVYQELTQRRVAILADHKLHHYRNGTKPLTSLPDELNVEAKPTNLELLKTYFEDGDLQAAANTLPKLCKKDLWHLYEHRASFFEVFGQDRKYSGANKFISHELNDLLHSRLTAAGYSELDIKYFLLDLQNSFATPIDHGIVSSPNELVEIVKGFGRLETSGFCSRIYREVCESGRNGYLSNFLTVLGSQMREFQDQRFPSNEGIPVTSDTLLAVLKEVSTAVEGDNFRNARSLYKREIAVILFRYASIWLDTSEESAHDFFERAKALGISPQAEEQGLDSFVRNGKVDFGDREITVFRERLAEAKKAFVGVFIGEIKPRPEEVEEKPAVNEDYIRGVFGEIAGMDDSWAKADRFSRLLYKIREHFDENGLPDAERLSLLRFVFGQIDMLPSDRASFYKSKSEIGFDENLPDLLKIGEAWKFYNNPLIKEEKNMDLVKKIAGFNLKMVAALAAFKGDGEEFYATVQQLMDTFDLDAKSLSPIEIMRLCRPLFSLDYKGKLHEVAIIGFGVYSQAKVASETVVVRDITRLENLSFMRSVMEWRPSIPVNSLDELIALSDKTREEYSDFFNTSYPGIYQNYYDDGLGIIILGEPVRRGLWQYLERGRIDYGEFDKLHDFLKSVLPDSADKDEILRGIREEYFSAPVPMSEKIEFFKTHSEELGIGGLVTLASQIRGEDGKPGSVWAQWEYFRDQLEDLIGEYMKGEKSAARIAVIDSVTSLLSRKHELAFASCESSPESAAKMSTELADEWVEKTMINPERSFGLGIYERLGEYSFSQGKFQLTKEGRVFFRSFNDVVRTLRNMGMGERAGIIMKALVGDKGALSSEEGREKLAELIKSSLDLDDPFICELAETLCGQAVPGTDTRTVFAALGSYLMGNLLFSGIKTEAVDVGKIIEQRPFLKGKIDADELRGVLVSGTREISAFGVQYQQQPATLMARMAKESDGSYSDTVNFLRGKFIHKEPFEGLETGTDGVPRNVEALFRGAETTILGTRAIQTTRQMRRFDNEAVDRRMARSFDRNPGMDPLRFFLALDSYAERDPDLAAYLKKNLIDIEGPKPLGGGSMATTYKARVLSVKHPGEEAEVVIRELTPGADLEIVKIGETVLRALDKMAGRPRGHNESRKAYNEERKNIRLAQVIFRFTMDWCLADIRDPNYESNDDRFVNDVVTQFNKASGSDFVKVPEREFSSKGNWVRVETMAHGSTVRNYLDDPSVSKEKKAAVVLLMARFNRFQYGQVNVSGQEALVQSDPSIGNYIVEETLSGPNLHVLDRGLMIPLTERRLGMVHSLFVGNYRQFLQDLVSEVVDYNIANNDRYKQLDSQTRTRLERSLKAKIIFNVVSSRFFGRTAGLSDSVTAVNDVFIDEDLTLPYEIEVPIKNAAGIIRLTHDYTSGEK